MALISEDGDHPGVSSPNSSVPRVATTPTRTPPSGSASPGGKLMRKFGSFQISPGEIKKEGLIAQGEFGAVYKGRCRTLPVAIKVPHKQKMTKRSLMNFIQEVQFMSEIFHPNVCLFMGACTLPGQIAMVTELMEGSLTSLLRGKDAKPYPLSTRLNWGLEAARGVAWLHSNNPPIMHLDIKPDNILFDSKLRIKVCDFGFSRFRDGPSTELTRAVGTPLYMAPEVMASRSVGSIEVTEKVDVYSFAIVLWEILTTKDPFPHHNNYILFTRAVLNGERPEIPEDCPPRLRDLLSNAWRKDPHERPSFQEIVSELEVIVEEVKVIERHAEIDRAIGDSFGARLWKKNFLWRDRVLWREFAPAFYSALSLPIPSDPEESFDTKEDEGTNSQPNRFDSTVTAPEIEENRRLLTSSAYRNISVLPPINEESRSLLCLKALLVDPLTLDISIDAFGKLLGWFGPVRTEEDTHEDSKSEMLNKIKEVLSHSWFHGNMSSSEAQNLLATERSGAYLVRFSGNSPNCFCLSRVGPQREVMHLVIPRDLTTGQLKLERRLYSSLPELLDSEKERLLLEYPVISEKYLWLFDEGQLSSSISGFDGDGSDLLQDFEDILNFVNNGGSDGEEGFGGDAEEEEEDGF